MKIEILERPNTIKVIAVLKSKKALRDYSKLHPKLCADQVVINDCVMLGWVSLRITLDFTHVMIYAM
jgi:hypothetical protein